MIYQDIRFQDTSYRQNILSTTVILLVNKILLLSFLSHSPKFSSSLDPHLGSSFPEVPGAGSPLAWQHGFGQPPPSVFYLRNTKWNLLLWKNSSIVILHYISMVLKTLRQYARIDVLNDFSYLGYVKPFVI